MKKPIEPNKPDPACHYNIYGQYMKIVDREHHTKIVQPCLPYAAYCQKVKKL